MKSVVITAAALWLIGAGQTMAREPGAPQPNNPEAGILVVSFLIELGLAAWALSTIF